MIISIMLVVTNGIISFFFYGQVIFHCMYVYIFIYLYLYIHTHHFLIRSFVDGHLGSFYAYTSTENIGVPVSLNYDFLKIYA